MLIGDMAVDFFSVSGFIIRKTSLLSITEVILLQDVWNKTGNGEIVWLLNKQNSNCSSLK